MLLFYVDDLLLLESRFARVAKIKTQLHKRYQMKDLEPVSQYLGVEFHRLTNGSLSLHQHKYIAELLDKCKLDLSMIEHISLPVGHVLEAATGIVHIDVSTYCHIVGKLIILCNTCPDLSYVVGVVTRYMHLPQQAHLDFVNHMLRYLNFTRDYGLL